MKTTILKIGLFTLALLSFSQIDAQNKKKQKPEKMFAKIDTNKDGSVSLEEFKARKVKKEIPTGRIIFSTKVPSPANPFAQTDNWFTTSNLV